ncbi:MAG: cytochrome c [Gammaproteobacteria bacterium]|nr:cytochrome c [Gammaproteobacteria bacterium]
MKTSMMARATTTVVKVGALAAAVIATTLLVYSIFPSSNSPAGELTPDDPEIVRSGIEVYAAQCAACHGAQLEGQPDWRRRGADNRLPAPPHDASGHTWHHPDDMLITITKHGPAAVLSSPYESNMPAYAGVLSDADIRAVLSYIKSTWPAEIRRYQDTINQQAR